MDSRTRNARVHLLLVFFFPPTILSNADKKTCDEYFTNKHRNEMRGCSGIFFDQLTTPSKRAAFDFLVELGNSFISLYAPFVDSNRDTPYVPVREATSL